MTCPCSNPQKSTSADMVCLGEDNVFVPELKDPFLALFQVLIARSRTIANPIVPPWPSPWSHATRRASVPTMTVCAGKAGRCCGFERSRGILGPLPWGTSRMRVINLRRLMPCPCISSLDLSTERPSRTTTMNLASGSTRATYSTRRQLLGVFSQNCSPPAA